MPGNGGVWAGVARLRGFFGRSGPLVLARMITAVLSTAIPLIFARALPLDEYGTYKQIFLIAQTAALVVPFGMAQSLYYFMPRTEQARPYLVNALGFLLAGALLSSALLYGMGGELGRLVGPGVLAYRGELCVYLIALIGSYPLEIGLTSRGRIGASAVVYLVTDTGRAAVMVIPAALGYGLPGAMAGLVAFSVLRLAATWVILLRGSEGPPWDRAIFLRQLAYAAPFGFAMLVARVSKDYHQYAVSGLFPPEVFAIYATGCFQLPLVDLLYTPTSEILMVRLGELDRLGKAEQALSAFREATDRLAFFFFPFAGFLFAAAPEFVGAVFGDKFLAAVPIFRLSVLGICLSILPIDGLLRARDQTRFILFASVVKALVSVPLVYAFVHAFGLLGAMAAYLLGETFGRILLLLRLPQCLSTRERRIGFREAIPWGALGRSLLSASTAAGAVILLRGGFDLAHHLAGKGILVRLAPLASAAVGFGLGYLAMLRCTGWRRPRTT